MSILTTALLLLSGCATAVPGGDAPSPDASGTLDATGWVLDSMGGEPPMAGTTLTLQVTPDGFFAGFSGCNRYHGKVRITGNSLDVGPINSTLMICEQPVMNQETSFVTMVQNAEKFVIEGDHLTLSGGSGAAALVFSAQPKDLQGGVWVVTGYNNGAEAVVSVVPDSVAEVSFGEDGTISGTGGCNRFTGQFTAKDGTLKIGPLGMTQMACPKPAGVMEQEAALVKVLESVSAYEIEGDGLHLTTEDGATAVTLTRG